MKMAALSQGLTGHLDCATLASHEQITTVNRISGLCARIQITARYKNCGLITALNRTVRLCNTWTDHSTQQDIPTIGLPGDDHMHRSKQSKGHLDHASHGQTQHSTRYPGYATRRQITASAQQLFHLQYELIKLWNSGILRLIIRGSGVWDS
jgi:hypothetical protein